MHDELIKHNKQGEAGVADFMAKVRCLPLLIRCVWRLPCGGSSCLPYQVLLLLFHVHTSPHLQIKTFVDVNYKWVMSYHVNQDVLSVSESTFHTNKCKMIEDAFTHFHTSLRHPWAFCPWYDLPHLMRDHCWC